MVSKTSSALLWIFAVIFTVSTAIYQRLTGPTHPKKVTVAIGGKEYTFNLLRTYEVSAFAGPADAPYTIKLPAHLEANLRYKRLNTNDEWTVVPMVKTGKEATAYLPPQPPAGKLEYFISLTDGKETVELSQQPTVIRFKGTVALYILIPHIFFMFMAMLLSLRTGLEALFKGHRTFSYTKLTVFSLLIGGLILGPIVQWMAFGDFWTGWPFGGDWTDNKTIVGFGVWLVALLVLRKNTANRIWPIIAFVVLFAIYMIPHSKGGSEYNYDKGAVETGTK